MEFVKRFGLWFIGGLLIAAAVGFYFVVVRSKASEFTNAKTNLEQRRTELEGWAKKKESIATPKGIEAAEEYGNLVTAQLKDCERYLAAQPRRANTRIFFEDERSGEKEFDIEAAPWKWVDAYRKHNLDLQEQLRASGFTAFTIQTLDSLWGSKPPTKDQVAVAMELYWYQKDMADFLTEQAERDLNDLIKAQNEADAKPDPFPTKVSDLVINRKPPRLDEFLRTLPQKKLIAVLEAILINEQQQDLPMIFNTLLPDDLPWERPAGDDKLSVLALTMDDQQRKYLEDLVPPPMERPDLANRQRFIDFIREIRGVRYRADVAGLLEGKTGFEDIAISVRKGTPEEHARIRTDIKNWSTTQLAQAIAEVVSIKEEKDYRFIRNNHSHGIAELKSLTMKHADQAGGSAAGMADEGGGGRGRGGRGGAPAAAAPGNTELYKLSTFTMDVRIEFERIPVFLRRLLSNNWRYKVSILSIVPVEAPTAAVATNEGFGGPRGPGIPPPIPVPMAVPAVKPTDPKAAEEPASLEARHFVLVSLNGEAFQFTPLYEKVEKEKPKPPAAGAPAVPGNPAVPKK